MRLLLDTHALIWWLAGDERLSPRARDAIATPGQDVLVSAVSGWEITTKHRIGKLPGVTAMVADMERLLTEQGFATLPISLRHGQVAGMLPGPHKDPFDRMLIAQCMVDGLVLVTNDPAFNDYGIARLW